MFEYFKSDKPRAVRNRALLGTAIAVVLGGALVGEAVLPKTQAFADAVRVEGVQPVSFADVVDKVRPAVVSVRVKSQAREVASDGIDQGDLFNGPGGSGGDNSPMEKFFRQFRQGPGGQGNNKQPGRTP